MISEKKHILILGASGMLGSTLLRFFGRSDDFVTVGSVRDTRALSLLPTDLHAQVRVGFDLENEHRLAQLLASTRPHVVINCVGIVKQLAAADEVMACLPVNTLLPHRLSSLCALAGARLIHLSTDCVFSGAKGLYTEADTADATDLYGRSKHMGEVDAPHALTLRTSMIGHELAGARSLVDWFLSQSGSVKGYRQAIFSGLPTIEIARVIRDHVMPFPQLSGLYHLSADPINKFDLLKLVAARYQKQIEIHPDDAFVIDRSLDSTRFRRETQFQPRPWPEMIQAMHEFG